MTFRESLGEEINNFAQGSWHEGHYGNAEGGWFRRSEEAAGRLEYPGHKSLLLCTIEDDQVEEVI